MKFLNQLHEKRYLEFITKDETDPSDLERKALFYILSGVDQLYELADEIYEFQIHLINTKGLENVESNKELELTNETKCLLSLAKDLYTAIREKGVTEVFSAIDDAEKFQLALNAIKLRFNKPLHL